jgi:hypothetical protein
MGKMQLGKRNSGWERPSSYIEELGIFAPREALSAVCSAGDLQKN